MGGSQWPRAKRKTKLVEDLVAGRMAPAPDPVSKAKTLKMVYAGIGGGVALVLLIIVVNLFLGPTKPPVVEKPPEESVTAPPAVEDAPPAPVAPEAIVQQAPPPPQPPPQPTVVVAKADTKVPGPTVPETGILKAPVAAPSSSAWTEPTDVVVPPPAEPTFAADVESKFVLPPWATTPIPVRLTGNILRVRRISDPTNPQERASLSSAFESLGADTTELMDNGPFIESDLRLHGGGQLVRATQGRRPIVRLDKPQA